MKNKTFMICILIAFIIWTAQLYWFVFGIFDVNAGERGLLIGIAVMQFFVILFCALFSADVLNRINGDDNGV